MPRPFTERFALDADSIVLVKKTVKLGDYWDLGEGMSRLKIAPLDLMNITERTLGVDIRFDTGGSVFYGGEDTLGIEVNRIILPATSNGFQAEPGSAYQYSFSDKHVHFKALRIDHINEVGKEVVMEFCSVALRKVMREDLP